MAEQRVGEQRRAGEIGGEHAHGVERRRLRQHAAAPDGAEAGLEPHHAAIGGGADHRAAGLRAHRQRRHARRHRRRRAGGGAAGRVRRVDRVARLRRLKERKLGRGGLAQDQRARRAQPGDRPGVFGRPAALVEDGAVLGRHRGGVDDVLDPDRQPVQRPDGPPAGAQAVEPRRLGARLRRVDERPGADLRLARFDLREAGLGQLRRPQRAGRKAVAQRDRPQRHQRRVPALTRHRARSAGRTRSRAGCRGSPSPRTPGTETACSR